MPSRAEVDRSHVLAWDRNAMPGMDIYGHWSDRDPNARAVGLAAIDTVLQLKLSGDGPGEAFQVPVPPVVTSRYGWRDGRNHNGIDLDEYRAATRAIGEGWRGRMGKYYPAMSLVKVAGLLEPGAKVEIEGTAVLP